MGKVNSLVQKAVNALPGGIQVLHGVPGCFDTPIHQAIGLHGKDCSPFLQPVVGIFLPHATYPPRSDHITAPNQSPRSVSSRQSLPEDMANEGQLPIKKDGVAGIVQPD